MVLFLSASLCLKSYLLIDAILLFEPKQEDRVDKIEEAVAQLNKILSYDDFLVSGDGLGTP